MSTDSQEQLALTHSTKTQRKAEVQLVVRMPTLLRRAEPCVAVAVAVVLLLGRWRLHDCAVVKGRQTRVVCAPVAWRDEGNGSAVIDDCAHKSIIKQRPPLSRLSLSVCLSVCL